MTRPQCAALLKYLIAGGMLLSQVALAQRANPADMERSPEVRRAGPVDSRIVGVWDVWISGAVTYTTDGRSVYQQYEPGAAMNRLEIASDGRYRWGNKMGRLVEVLPWHHQSGRRYYRVVHSGGTEYDFYHADGDRLVILFGGVGGHASTGTRLTGNAASASSAPVSPAAPRPPAGERVEVEWKGRWLPARVVGVEGGRYRISYDGYDSSWDEWVTPARIRKPGADNRQAAPSPTGQSPHADSSGAARGAAWGGNRGGNSAPSQPPGNNPLGVEWAGSGTASQPAPPQPSGNNRRGTGWGGNRSGNSAPSQPSGNNPLGVEWTGGSTGSQPAPTQPSGNNPPGVEWAGSGNASPAPANPTPNPTKPDQPRRPAPVTPPAPKEPQPTPPAPKEPQTTPPAPPQGGGLAAALTDRWLYQAVAFVDGSGTVSETRGVSGSLTFKSDGSYDQALSIGGILNAIKGTYRVSGNRVVTSYQWGGKAASDELVAELDATGDKLTLVRHGSPTAYYTLRRAN